MKFSLCLLLFLWISPVSKVDAFIGPSCVKSFEPIAEELGSNCSESPAQLNDDALHCFTRRHFIIGIGCLTSAVANDVSALSDTQIGVFPTSTSSSASVLAPVREEVKPIDFKQILNKASKKAFGKGKSGASAAVVQVLALMWLRTTMNYQYRNGGSTIDSIKKLYEEGGIPRFYQGLPFAVIQGPLSRFGDTAANAGVIALLDAFPMTSNLPLPLKSAGGSVAAGLWRIVLTPIDTIKTTLQVGGSTGGEALLLRLKQEGPSALFQGAVATSAATFVGHFPWYLTYNALGDFLPLAPEDDLLLSLLRAAFMGLCASSVSDCCSNSIRVLKTTKQTAPEQISYADALDIIIKEGGLKGLFGRGLQTRLAVNGLQGALFSVLWKLFER